MGKKEVLIIGGGISGLSAALKLESLQKNVKITILEKEKRVGGVIRSEKEPFFFEKGPRTFKISRSKELIKLASFLGMQHEMIFANEMANSKYIWQQNALCKVPSNPLAFLFSPLTKGLIFSLLKERKIPKVLQDETIYDFISRRFNKRVAETLFDPIVKGIYAGDIHKLSIRACFPALKEWEKNYGSITKGFFCASKQKGRSLFTFKNGIESLISRMEAAFSGRILRGEETKKIEMRNGKVSVSTNGKTFIVDHVILAGSVQAMKKLLPAEPFFSTIPSYPISVINIEYDKKIAAPKGFGYLVPSNAKEKILGCVFDSQIFPQQNTVANETRLTVMAKEDVLEKEALIALKKHLHINELPRFIRETKYKEGIPQYQLGHVERVLAFLENFEKKCPQISIIGNYLSGVSVNDCIKLAHQTVARVSSRLDSCKIDTRASISS
ncbi:MAG: protoporphyrinogen oxidase [Simkaniaceae bacterium]|nr:protoporphyrinogen oxidase [Simkaniaceae bacterium]